MNLTYHELDRDQAEGKIRTSSGAETEQGRFGLVHAEIEETNSDQKL
jgi:hypothetical protein